MSLPVFLTEPGSLSALGPGDQHTLAGPEARHAASVMRVGTGDRIQLVDGAGVRLTGAVSRIEAGPELVVEVSSIARQGAGSPQLVLVQALAKGGRDELAIEAGTEVGADVVVPWQAERCVSRWRGPKAAKGVAKWQQTVSSATKQSRRSHLPRVLDLHDTPALVAAVRGAVTSGDAVLLAHEEAAGGLSQTVLPPQAGRVWILIGPEGGIGDGEAGELREAGAQSVTLGPHVLRASTAGPVALALLRERLSTR